MATVETSPITLKTDATNFRLLTYFQQSPLFYLFCLWSALAGSLVSVGGISAISLRWPVGILAGALGFGYYLLRPKVQRPALILQRWGMLILGLCFFSTIYSPVPEYTFLRSGGLFLIFLFVFFGVASYINSLEKIKIVFGGFIIISLIGAITSIYGFNPSEVNLTASNYRYGLSGNNLKSTGFAFIAINALPILFWCVKYIRKKWRWLLIFLIVGLFFLILATKSRTSLGAAVIILPATYMSLRNYRNIFSVFFVSIFIVVIGAILVSSSDTLQRVLRLDSDDITTGRSVRWDAALEEGANYPILGHGFGTSRYYKADWGSIRVGLENVIDETELEVTHNEHITLFFELGMFGLLFFWWIISVMLFAGLKIINLSPSVYRDMLIVVFFSWFANLLDTFTHDPFFTIGNPSAFWFWMKVTFIYCGYFMLKKAY